MPQWPCHQAELYDHLVTSVGSASEQASPPNLCTALYCVLSSEVPRAVVSFAALTGAVPEHIIVKYNTSMPTILLHKTYTYLRTKIIYVCKS